MKQIKKLKKQDLNKGRHQLRSVRGGRMVVVWPDGVTRATDASVPTERFPAAALAAARVASTALGDVRTTVAVSLRGTAWRLASAAVCGLTPTAAGADAPAMGAVTLVCATAPTDTLTMAAATSKVRARVRVRIRKKFLMIWISPWLKRQKGTNRNKKAQVVETGKAGVEAGGKAGGKAGVKAGI